ncbi:MAG: phosphatidate cytidylyltransferase [Armatimonadetes bacterium]|nr:phosphatidate cytidylyltransferase [Armatimonadota bacterium]
MELIKRVLIAVIFIPLILFIFYLGGFALSSLLGLIVFIQMFEFREMFIKKGITISVIMLPFSILVFISSAYFNLNMVIASLFIVFIFVSGNDLVHNKLEGSLNRISTSLFSVIYTAVFLSSVYRIRNMENGAFLILSLIALIWITDSFAYFIGRKYGKHRGIFKASPKKSLQGFLAGILFAFIGAFIIAEFTGFTIIQTLAVAISAGIFGQFGDLFESMLKRDVGIKDSSTIIPGHGGILDRFDSLLLAAPAFYLLLSFIH